jgi:hypothetical protein
MVVLHPSSKTNDTTQATESTSSSSASASASAAATGLFTDWISKRSPFFSEQLNSDANAVAAPSAAVLKDFDKLRPTPPC